MIWQPTISRRAPLLSAALCAAAFGTSSAADEEPLSVAQECLHQHSIKRTKVLNDRNILFVDRDGQNYVNQLLRQCPSMRRNSLLNYPIANSRLCAGNSFVVLLQAGMNNYVPSFVCQLGMFAPVSEDEVADIMAMTKEPDSPRARRRSERDMVETERVELPQPATEAAAETAPGAP
jgi:hypothetical protein